MQKYKISESTPSPTDSEKTGNYFRNLAFRPSSTDDGSSGKRVSSIQFDTGRYDPHDNDDVFVISHSDSSVYSQKSKQKRVESNRTSDENPTKAKTRKICFIIIFLIVILGLIAGIAVIVVFYVINISKYISLFFFKVSFSGYVRLFMNRFDTYLTGSNRRQEVFYRK